MKLFTRNGVLPPVEAGATAGPTDAGQFEAFVRRYEDMVFATAVRLVGNETDAEDIAQTVFMRAFRRFDQIGSSAAAPGWLKTVTRNACLNHLTRYRARVRFFSELEPSGAAPAEPPDAKWAASAPAPSEAELTERRHEAVERALRELPDHQRVPLALFHFENMTYQEIADMLGISLGKVKTDIHRGRETLRAMLAPDHASR